MYYSFLFNDLIAKKTVYQVRCLYLEKEMLQKQYKYVSKMKFM